MMIFAVVDDVAFTEFGYIRNGKYRAYRDNGTITINGSHMATYRWIAYAQCSEWQRRRFSNYDAHHINGRGMVLSWYSIAALTAGKHRKLHR